MENAEHCKIRCSSLFCNPVAVETSPSTTTPTTTFTATAGDDDAGGSSSPRTRFIPLHVCGTWSHYTEKPFFSQRECVCKNTTLGDTVWCEDKANYVLLYIVCGATLMIALGLTGLYYRVSRAKRHRTVSVADVQHIVEGYNQRCRAIERRASEMLLLQGDCPPPPPPPTYETTVSTPRGSLVPDGPDYDTVVRNPTSAAIRSSAAWPSHRWEREDVDDTDSVDLPARFATTHSPSPEPPQQLPSLSSVAALPQSRQEPPQTTRVTDLPGSVETTANVDDNSNDVAVADVLTPGLPDRGAQVSAQLRRPSFRPPPLHLPPLRMNSAPGVSTSTV